MVLRFEDNQGIQALDQNQIIEVFSGNSVSNGVDTTINSGTLGQSDTLQVASGDVIVGGSKVSVSQQNVQIDSSDPDNPRKDVVYVDSNGDVQVDKGTPEDPEPEGANRFDLFQPAPPERNNVDGAVVAEVFVGAGVSSISTDDVRDRRLISNLTVDELKFFDSLNFADDQNLNFGDDPDFSIRYDSTDDELKVKDEVNDTEKQAWDKSGDTFFRNGAVQVGKDIKTTGNQTIWDSSATEIPDSAMGSIDNATLTNSAITINTNDGVGGGGSVSLGGSVGVNVNPSDFAGNALTTSGTPANLDVATDGIQVDEIDQSITPTWTGQHTFSSGISMDSTKITNLSDPTNPQDAATKTYADALEQGLDIKDSVRAASQSDIDLASATDPNPVDGVTLNDGDRVLLKSQTDGTENGIYIASTATDPTTWTRSADSDEDSEVSSGMFMFVEEGTESGNESYILVTDDPITLGTTSLSFTVFSRAGEITAGSGLAKSGNTLSVNTANGLEVVSDNVQIQTDAIGSNELDTSVGYSFSSQIDFKAGIGGGGNQINVKDGIDLEGNTLEVGLNQIQENGTTVFDITSDTIDIPQKPLRISANDPFPEIRLEGDSSTGGAAMELRDSSDSNNPLITKIIRNNSNNQLLFAGGDPSNSTLLLSLDDSGNLDLINSGSIQDSGTNAISFDGSGNPQFPNKIGGDGSKLFFQDDFQVEGTLRTDGMVQPRGGGRNSFFDADANPAIFGAGGSFGNNIEFGDLIIQPRSNAQRKIVMANFDGTNIKKSLLVKESHDIELPNGNLSITQDGTSTDPALEVGDAGAGFFVNSSGEVVVVDEAGNTTTIS